MQEELACWIEKAEDTEKHNQELQDRIADLQVIVANGNERPWAPMPGASGKVSHKQDLW